MSKQTTEVRFDMVGKHCFIYLVTFIYDVNTKIIQKKYSEPKLTINELSFGIQIYLYLIITIQCVMVFTLFEKVLLQSFQAYLSCGHQEGNIF